LSLQAIEDEVCGGKDLTHGSSWSEASVDTGTPSESSCNAASEEDDDRPLPAIETFADTYEKGCRDIPPPTLQPGFLMRSMTSELTQDVPTLLDRMNVASDRVNCLEREAGASQARYKRRLTRYEDVYKRMRAEFGSVFDTCKPLCRDPAGLRAAGRRAQLGESTVEELARCYQILNRHHDALAEEHLLMDRLSQKVRVAKRAYASTISELEVISNSVHVMRQKR